MIVVIATPRSKPGRSYVARVANSRYNRFVNDSPRVAIIGAGGQLASEFSGILAGASVFPFSHQQLDIGDPEAVAQMLGECRPEVVINCAAYNRVDDAELDPQAAFQVNAIGVRYLARACLLLGAKLVHISTDYVFDGHKREPYLETDCPRPVSAYGISKYAGELFAQAECARTFVIRTAGLYGAAGRKQKGGRGHFVEFVLNGIAAGHSLRIVTDQVTAPTWCKDLAAKVMELIGTETYGTYHLTNAGSCTWFEFAQTIMRLTGRETELVPISSADLGARARRPAYSLLANDALACVGIPPMRNWNEALARYLAETQ